MPDSLPANTWKDVTDVPVDPYPYARIWINGRYVSLDRIVADDASPRTPFEEYTFAFVRDWLSGTEEFTLTTSGSTGPPRPINISRAQMVAGALRTARKLNLRPGTTALVCIDTRYIGGMMMLVRSLTLGLRLMVVEPTANPLIKIPVDKWVQFTAFVPYQIKAILESKHPHLLNNLKHVLIGGAPLHPADIERLQRYQCACYETYGMTETVSHVALRLVNTAARQSSFEALEGVSLSLDDRGCLVITADHLPGEVVTNDIVTLEAPDKFRWLGRADNVINTGGIKVIPENVEPLFAEILAEQQLDFRFFIAGLPDEKLGHRVVLVLEGVQFSSEALQQSLAALQARVSPYAFPKEVYVSDAFSETASGKVHRQQTLQQAAFLTPAK